MWRSADDDMMFMGGGPHLAGGPAPFVTNYRCYSVSCFHGSDCVRENAERGGKVIMPPSALETLSRFSLTAAGAGPMIFQMTNKSAARSTHCGLLEFTADEGRVYVPYWIMRTLLIEEGALVELRSVTLPDASFAKFQPQSVDFLDIHNQKAVLENELRHFACLSVGDELTIKYNNKNYELLVLELRPANAVKIVDCDVNVDFAPPVGYEDFAARREADQRAENERLERQEEEMECAPPPESLVGAGAGGFRPFGGAGQRLNGKPLRDEAADAATGADADADGGGAANGGSAAQQYGVPNYGYQPGLLQFWRRRVTKPEDGAEGSADTGFKPFEGLGHKLKMPTQR